MKVLVNETLANDPYLIQEALRLLKDYAPNKGWSGAIEVQVQNPRYAQRLGDGDDISVYADAMMSIVLTGGTNPESGTSRHVFFPGALCYPDGKTVLQLSPYTSEKLLQSAIDALNNLL